MEHRVVLMIDEDHEFASIIEIKLKSEGFDVRLAGTSEAGMQLIREAHPDLVLLDINLPGMNGIDFLGV
jgi:DNA-binding response OmpR family regulator